jgi:hypothetical protein
VKAFVVNVTDKVKTFLMKNQKRGVMWAMLILFDAKQTFSVTGRKSVDIRYEWFKISWWWHILSFECRRWCIKWWFVIEVIRDNLMVKLHMWTLLVEQNQIPWAQCMSVQSLLTYLHGKLTEPNVIRAILSSY